VADQSSPLVEAGPPGLLWILPSPKRRTKMHSQGVDGDKPRPTSTASWRINLTIIYEWNY